MCMCERHRQIRAAGMLHFHVRAVMCSDYTCSFRYNNLFSCSLQSRRMRAMENKMIIKTGYSDTSPLGVDTDKDLKQVTKEMV